MRLRLQRRRSTCVSIAAALPPGAIVINRTLGLGLAEVGLVFMLVRTVNKAKEAAEKKEEAPEAAPDPGPSEKDILIEIRDALQK